MGIAVITKRDGETAVSTLAIRLLSGQRRGSRNTTTELALPAMPIPTRHANLRGLFTGAYDAIAEACRAVDEPGLALVAVDEHTGVTCGFAIVRARIARHVVAMIGRHDRCDLYLDKRAALALRQLLVIVDPVSSFTGGACVRYRIMDLRTEHGFLDERGRPLRGVRADGPAIVRCAGYAVFALPLGDPTDWPASAADAWAMLPERVYLEEADAAVERRSMRRSLLFPIRGPRESGMILSDSSLAGTLELAGPSRGGTLAVGIATLRDGLVLGRYVRCDGAQMVDDPLLSRVHVMLLQLGDTLLAIDTASTHGIRLVGCPAERVIHVPDRAELALGRLSKLIWTRRPSLP
jgi:hypothetical protein